MKYFRFIPVVVLLICATFPTQSVFSQTAPVAIVDTATILEDAATTSIDVIANDTDADSGDALTLTAVATAGTGTVAINSDGVSVDYTPAADFNGTEVITYTVSDGTDSDDTGTLTVTVTSVNDAPVAIVDTATILEDAATTSIDVIANDTDADSGDALTLTAVATAGTGTVAINSDGVSVDYTPAADFNGTEVITYTVSDGTDSDDTGTLTVTVTSVNDAPVAVADTATVDEDAATTSIDVIANDTDADSGDTLTLTAVATAGTGTVAINSDGVSVDYTPAADFNGTEVITYTVSDGTLTDETGTLTVTVTSVNDAPVAVADTATVDEDAATTSIDVIANDTDPDTADTLILTAVATAGTGTVAINLDGVSVDYTPAADFNGTEVITYTVSDGTLTDETGTLTVTVTSVDDAPVAVADTATVDEDAATTSIDVIANDTDPDTADTLILTAVATAGTGTVAINLDGVSVDYTPAADFNGTEVITYTVSDGTLTDETGTLTVTVTSVDDAPVAVADTATVDEDAATTSIDVIANDTDPDTADTLILTAVATAGTGTVAINLDGVSVDYTPAADFNGAEVITYTVSDGTDSDDTGTLTVTVNPVNDFLPIAVVDTETVLEDAATTSIDVIANDTDADTEDTLTLTAVATAGTGTVAINEDGVSVDYTPAADFNGTEVITYTVSDGTDSDETGTLTVTVTSVNDAPVAYEDRVLVDEDSATTSIDVIANDIDVDTEDTLTLTAVTTSGSGTVSINTDNVSVDYTPAADFKGTEVITYTVSDGTLTDETGTLTVIVNDDSREITALSSSSASESETSGSFVITSTIDAVSSVDVIIPLSFSGDATLNQDYTVDFDTEGDETTIYNSGSNSYGKMKILPDGKYLFLEGTILRIYNPEDESLITRNLNNYYEGNIGIGVVSSTSFYAKINQGSIYKVDFSDLDAITETSYIGLANNSWVNSPFTLSGETLYYSVYSNITYTRTQFKKVGDADPEIIGTLNDDFKIVELNNKVYFISNYWFQEYLGEVLTNSQPNYFNIENFEIYNYRIQVYNNELYVLNMADSNRPGKLSISGNQVSYNSFSISEDANVIDLDINPITGNLILQNYEYQNGINLYTVSSYQLAPQLKIAAGNDSGSITITGKSDELYELTESLIVQPGTPVSAVYNTSLTTNGIATPFNLEITSDDSLPEATYAFSSPTIQEFPYEEVTLTATLSAISGLDVTIPFTLSDNASAAVVVVSSEIVILAGQLSGSITVSTTEDLDDNDVEILEPIVFTFGTISNATSEYNRYYLKFRK